MHGAHAVRLARFGSNIETRVSPRYSHSASPCADPGSKLIRIYLAALLECDLLTHPSTILGSIVGSSGSGVSPIVAPDRIILFTGSLIVHALDLKLGVIEGGTTSMHQRKQQR